MSKLISQLKTDLAAAIDPDVVEDLLAAYQELIAKHRAGDLQTALTKAGRFVEHALRLIEFVSTGAAPTEIKSVATTIRTIENDTNLSESLRLLIPRALYGMVYNVRSKRNAVHVKEIDPTDIDVAMSVAASSWVLAELLRMYHSSDEAKVKQAMAALSRTSIPFIQTIDGEVIVSQDVDPRTEVLLLLANAGSEGITRTDLGRSAKCSASSVTRCLQKLGGKGKRHVHLSSSKLYFITNSGELELANILSG